MEEKKFPTFKMVTETVLKYVQKYGKEPSKILLGTKTFKLFADEHFVQTGEKLEIADERLGYAGMFKGIPLISLTHSEDCVEVV